MPDAAPSVVSVRPLPASTGAPAWLHIGLFALLLAELLYLTISFDTQALTRAGSFWTSLVGWSPQYLRVAIAATFAVLLIALTGVSSVRWNDAADTRPSRGWFAFHLAAFASFIWLTRTFFTGTGSVAANPGVWTAAWFLAGTVMIASWALAAFPQRRWWTTAVENRALMLVSLAAGTAIWAASFIGETFWTPLARYTFNVVTWVLGLLSFETVSRPEQLIVGTPKFRVLISPECSGYEGIGLILAFLTIYLFVLRRELRFPGALILLPIGAAVMWILNVGRIVTLIAIGAAGWPAIAAGGFHSQAGWLAFNAVALGFVALTSRAGYFRTPSEPRERQSVARRQSVSLASDSTTALLAPFVAMLAASMVTGAFSAGFDWLYGVRIVAVVAVMWMCRGVYRTLDWRGSWGAFAIGAATFVMWVSLFPSTLHDKAGWPVALASVNPFAAGTWLAIRLVGYVLVIPAVEELAFRAYAMRRLMDSDVDAVPVGRFSLAAFVISSLLFGALHGPLWIQGTLAGMAFAGALCWRRRFGDAVMAHATTNALIAIYVFVTGHWSVWS
jgi:exosortase E/protease (VPEID-CTERM system)